MFPPIPFTLIGFSASRIFVRSSAFANTEIVAAESTISRPGFRTRHAHVGVCTFFKSQIFKIYRENARIRKL